MLTDIDDIAVLIVRRQNISKYLRVGFRHFLFVAPEMPRNLCHSERRTEECSDGTLNQIIYLS